MPWKWGQPRAPPAPGSATKEAPGEGRAPEGTRGLGSSRGFGGVGGMDPPGCDSCECRGKGGREGERLEAAPGPKSPGNEAALRNSFPIPLPAIFAEL